MPLVKCLACTKEFYVPKYRSETAKYCSINCLNHGRYQSIKKICVGCNNEFYVSNSRVRKKFCSEICRTLDSVSIKDRRKQQKIATALNRGYRSKYRRIHILNKLGRKCSQCGYCEHDFCLDIHHLDVNPNNNELNNFLVLCAICHRKLHKGFIQCHLKKEVVAK